MRTSPPSPDGMVLEAAVHSSPLDTRKYRALTLHNCLRALVVSDMHSDHAATSLNIAVGSYCDPPYLPGLAHFTEHMLDLGCAKYPEEGSFKNFLAENGGKSNAHTASETTHFHFDLHVVDRDPDHASPRFREALDRFAQMFTAPLFTESATDREVNAVHSEFQKNLLSDSRRIKQVKRTVSNPAHPYSKFASGSKTTLYDTPRSTGVDTRMELLHFHREFYSANLMTLCIIAPYPLDLLQQWVSDMFSVIHNHQRSNPCEDYRHLEPLLPEHRGLIFHIERVDNIRSLEISWMTPTFIHDYYSKPSKLVRSMLADKGEGSIISLLKKHGWAKSISAEIISQRTFGSIGVHVSLTADGVHCLDEVITIIFQYVRMLKAAGIPKWLYDEEAALSNISFHFRERKDPVNFVMKMTARMEHTLPEDYLTSDTVFKIYSPEKIQEVLSCMTVERSNVIIGGNFEARSTDQKEFWYGSPYRVQRIDQKRLQQWSEGDFNYSLHLPDANHFIPSEFDLLSQQLPEHEKDADGPRLIEHKDRFQLHHKLDRTFRRPHAHVMINLLSPLCTTIPSWAIKLVKRSLTELLVPAGKAGFTVTIDQKLSGLTIGVHGYSHRIDVVLLSVLRKMRDLRAAPKRLEWPKNRKTRKRVNFAILQPSSLAMINVSRLMVEQPLTVRADTDETKSRQVDLGASGTIVHDILSSAWLNGLVYGNISEETAMGMMKGVHETLEFCQWTKPEMQSLRVVQIPVGRDVFIRMENPNKADNNSAIAVFYQVGLQGDFVQDMTLELLSRILERPAFYELRTVQQLGYIVSLGLKQLHGVGSLYINVQSTIADPDELLDRIDAFMADARENILGVITDDRFGDYVKALLVQKGEPDMNMSQRVERLWGEISNGFWCFDRADREMEALRKVEKEDVVTMFDTFLAKGGKQLRKVVSQVYGREHPYADRRGVAKDAYIVDDMLNFRKTNSLYPIAASSMLDVENGWLIEPGHFQN